MWILCGGEGGATAKFWLVSGEYSIGRKDADIVLLNDKSVSRRHATLLLAKGTAAAAAVARGEPTPPSDAPLTLRVIDCASKFGVFVNGERIAPGAAAGGDGGGAAGAASGGDGGASREIRDGDVVRFGANDPPTELVARLRPPRVLIAGPRSEFMAFFRTGEHPAVVRTLA